jgi:uncharacterized protein DUF503
MVAHLILELSIEAAHSLKDKRQIVRSLSDPGCAIVRRESCALAVRQLAI